MFAQLVALLPLLGLVSAAPSFTGGKQGIAEVIPGRYIIQFDTASSLQSSPLGKRAVHETVYEELRNRGVLDFVVNQEYSSNDIFVGASISVSNVTQLTSLANVTGIIGITPVHRITMPLPDSISPAQWNAAGQPAKNQPPLNTATASASASTTTVTTCTTQKKKKTCTTTTNVIKATGTTRPNTGFSFNSQIGADKVQASGNTGKGVKVAVIDGGVDYTLAPLGGCFGAGCKIAGGYDFVDNDPNPLDQCLYHGTFIAGVVAANDNVYNIPGVAPGASIYSYRVFDCNFQTTDDLVIQAMIKAYLDGVDIVTLSLSEPSGWTEGTLAVIAAKLVSKGVFVSSSAGNGGELGAFYSVSPAAGTGVTAVGASNNTNLVAWNATVVGDTHAPIRYYSGPAFPFANYPVYTFPDGSNGCNNASVYGDLSPYVVLVTETQDPNCPTFQQASTVHTNGGAALIQIQNVDHEPVYTNLPAGFNYAQINPADGAYLLSKIPKGQSNSGAFKLSFAFNPAPRYNSYSGGLMSYFSQIGPTWDMFMATQVTGPGTHIFGLAPATQGNWSVSDGTSFSTPMVAGIAALYLSANPNATPAQIRTAIENSGTWIPNSLGSNLPKTVAAQGAGLFNANTALNAGISVSPSELLLNDTANGNYQQWVTVTNTGNKWQWFKFNHIPAGTIPTLYASVNQSYDNANGNEIPASNNPASAWSTAQWGLPLAPGMSLPVLVSISPPSGLDPNTYPIFSGFFQITGGNAPIQLPYLGVAANMKNHPVWDGSNAYYGFNLPTTLDQNGNLMTTYPQTFDFTYNGNVRDVPQVLWRQVGGTRFATLDLVDANANLGFAPNYNSKRSLSEANEEANMMLKRVLEGDSVRKLNTERRQLHGPSKRGGANPNLNFGGLVGFWCQITDNQGIGCPNGGAAPGGSNTYSQVPIVGNLYELDYSPRASDTNDGNDHVLYNIDPPVFSNGTVIPNGQYRFMLRGLKVGGDIGNQADYDTWVGEPFIVAYAPGQPNVSQ